LSSKVRREASRIRATSETSYTAIGFRNRLSGSPIAAQSGLKWTWNIRPRWSFPVVIGEANRRSTSILMKSLLFWPWTIPVKLQYCRSTKRRECRGGRVKVESNHQSSLLNSTILLVFVPLLLFVTPQQFAVFVKRCEL